MVLGIIPTRPFNTVLYEYDLMPTQTNRGCVCRAKDTLWQNDDNILNRERHLKAIFKQMIIDLINSLIYDT